MRNLTVEVTPNIITCAKRERFNPIELAAERVGLVAPVVRGNTLTVTRPDGTTTALFLPFQAAAWNHRFKEGGQCKPLTIVVKVPDALGVGEEIGAARTGVTP